MVMDEGSDAFLVASANLEAIRSYSGYKNCVRDLPLSSEAGGQCHPFDNDFFKGFKAQSMVDPHRPPRYGFLGTFFGSFNLLYNATPGVRVKPSSVTKAKALLGIVAGRGPPTVIDHEFVVGIQHSEAPTTSMGSWTLMTAQDYTFAIIDGMHADLNNH